MIASLCLRMISAPTLAFVARENRVPPRIKCGAGIYPGRCPDQSGGGKGVVPDFQDQVLAIRIFQEADRGIGIDLDNPVGVAAAVDIREQVDGGGAQSQRVCGPARQRQHGLGRRRLSIHRPARAEIHPSRDFPTGPGVSRDRAKLCPRPPRPAKGHGCAGRNHARRAIAGSSARRRRSASADISARCRPPRRRAGKPCIRVPRKSAGSGLES